MKDILEQEIARRRALYDQALALFAPVSDVIARAHAAGAEVTLALHAPATRRDDAVRGTLRCRSFHDGVGPDTRAYAIVIAPGAERCTVELWGTVADLSADDYRDYVDKYEEEYRERFDPAEDGDAAVVVWSRDYAAAGKPARWTIADLRDAIEEALITDAAERKGGLGPFEIG